VERRTKYTEDWSCGICYPIAEYNIPKGFQEFWKIFSKVVIDGVKNEGYNRNTVYGFMNLMSLKSEFKQDRTKLSDYRTRILCSILGIQHFHKYLVNRKFKVITDHAALKGLMKAKVPKGCRAR
jgi:HSP90 family molecular chaperone